MNANHRVLVVDDDAVVGRSISRVLTERGYQVREATSGGEALEELDHHDYELVFTDIRMPGMDGLELTRRVRLAHPEVPVVMITGYGTEASERRAREIGVAGFLHKPLSPEVIVENAERALREQREIREAIRQSALAMAAPTATATATATPAATVAAAAVKRESVAKNIALFFAAPFIGLAYILAFPFVGLWMVGKMVWKKARGRG